MSHLCPTCCETCYCMADHSEINSGHRAYCMHCREPEIDLGRCCASCGEHVPDHADWCLLKFDIDFWSDMDSEIL